ncbi:Sensory neuron membrane protein 1, partial [Gryllus bimaculatus]
DVLRDGVDAYRFELPDNFFDRFEDPSTDCFAGDPSAPLVSGLSDCSPCFFNFPIAASAPHFMNGDPVLIDSVRGMNPQRDKHGSYIVVEPITGLPMESCARIQSNLVVRKLSGISKKLERFSNISIPMFWAEYYQKDLPWYIYYFLYFVVNILPDLQSWISFIMVTSGIGMLIAGLTSAMCASEKRKNNSYKFLDLTTSSSCSSSSSS